ncbi:hypothetical protein LJR153_002119 [Paenibacillus sp. LjRoot153]|uniref:hypothetical protein n=1 Tax=Paenibacillus sp. LjRoot153 TaxID=3342270 RepID=UPI003ED05B9F
MKRRAVQPAQGWRSSLFGLSRYRKSEDCVTTYGSGINIMKSEQAAVITTFEEKRNRL